MSRDKPPPPSRPNPTPFDDRDEEVEEKPSRPPAKDQPKILN